MTRIFGILIAVLFLSVGHTASAQTVKFVDRVSAFMGNAEAQTNLGYAYKRGRGVEIDYEQAAKWFRKAAKKGNVDAQVNLGFFYTLGKGVERDYEQAVKWHRKAAEQGVAHSQSALGRFYFHGDGVSKNYTYAYMWFSISADNDYSRATEERSEVAEQMTPEQLAEAQKLARECVRKEYKDC